MSLSTVEFFKEKLLKAGFQIYKVSNDEIQLAERVRMHLMDSGIRIYLREKPVISFRMRAQRSDFPHIPPQTLFRKIREITEESANNHGFSETASRTYEIKDPIDCSRILDVWHEITYSKIQDNLDKLFDDLHWVIQLDRYLIPR